MKLLIIYNKIWPYRVPIFNLLNEKYDLTVSYSLGSFNKKGIDFQIKYLPGYRVSRFYIHKNSLHKICKDYDVIIGYGDIGWLSLMLLLFRKRKYKIILWGIGVRASYNSKYGESTGWDKIRFFLMKKADALLFYSENPIELYMKKGFTRDKLFVANNTVAVKKDEIGTKRNTILFIGTLYKQKQIYELLNSYLLAYHENPDIPKLEIIGDGDEFENINSWIIQNDLNKLVYLRGKIFDEDLLCEYFGSSIACISPGQAGLSVLKSMGYGVPYITQKDAITGGEIFNIKNNVNGILYDEHCELKDIILDIATNKEKYINMGVRAKSHYYQKRKPADMVNGVIEAVEYVINKNAN